MTVERVRCRLLDEWFFEDFKPNGYDAGRPPWWHHQTAAEEIDREVAEGADCDACGFHGLRWWPVHNARERSYRAFVCCPACGHATEF